MTVRQFTYIYIYIYIYIHQMKRLVSPNPYIFHYSYGSITSAYTVFTPQEYNQGLKQVLAIKCSTEAFVLWGYITVAVTERKRTV
jgi:hypothetical protein